MALLGSTTYKKKVRKNSVYLVNKGKTHNIWYCYFAVLQLYKLMSEITLGELTIFGEDGKLDTLIGK